MASRITREARKLPEAARRGAVGGVVSKLSYQIRGYLNPTLKLEKEGLTDPPCQSTDSALTSTSIKEYNDAEHLEVDFQEGDNLK